MADRYVKAENLIAPIALSEIIALKGVSRFHNSRGTLFNTLQVQHRSVHLSAPGLQHGGGLLRAL